MTPNSTTVDDTKRPSSAQRSTRERTCAGCRKVFPQHELLRFAVGPEAPFVVPDPSRKLGGRGVSVRPRRACLLQAVRKGGFSRGARRALQLDERAVLETVAAHYERRQQALIRQAVGRRAVALGTDAVRDALRAGGVRLLVVAHDAAGKRQEIEDGARRLGAACVLVRSKAALGALAGKQELGVLAILDEGFADALQAVSMTLRAVREDDE